MSATKTKKPHTNKAEPPLPEASAAGAAGARKERIRTLAILSTFLHAEGVPEVHKDIVRVIFDRIEGRSIAQVLGDDEPVIQHQPEQAPPKRRAA